MTNHLKKKKNLMCEYLGKCFGHTYARAQTEVKLNYLADSLSGPHQPSFKEIIIYYDVAMNRCCNMPTILIRSRSAQTPQMRTKVKRHGNNLEVWKWNSGNTCNICTKADKQLLVKALFISWHPSISIFNLQTTRPSISLALKQIGTLGS